MEQEGSAATKLATVKSALAQVERDDERRLALSALSSIPLPGALDLAAGMLDRKSLQGEACLAVVTIAESLTPAQRKAATAALRKVAQTATDRGIKFRANALIRGGFN